ncbi:hypothetical protein [Novosphingobium cyanobacteriorum]|uniref:Uncharacterized protein n=1 Tax=Novosphingobium cyanobacteriorum TaxID=3024215 RepID=A0ABT6CMQ3_9SPHN|nr:hypothetical protein [Novosphingobium cyanobacteriorum]MDF8334804.1 hypothetical protein [Novosphingobium cyanobacteriorum]
MSTPHLTAAAPSGHPFRRSLPPRVLRPMPQFEPEVVAAMERAEMQLRSPDVNWKKLTLQDVKDFLLAYCACFLAVATFIS